MSSQPDILNASAPGTLMLMGEHAVLHGTHALCAAVNRRMHLRLHPREDRRFSLASALGDYDGDLDDFEVCKPFSFVLAAIQQARPRKGFHLQIRSEFSDRIGFGSSAAVTVATVSLLRALNRQPFDRAAILHEALTAVRQVQGQASGTDVAAAVYGGIVHYCADPLFVEPMQTKLPLSVVYAGYKTPTPEVIRLVERQRQQNPERFAGIFQGLAACVAEAVPAIRAGDLQTLGTLFDAHQRLQADMGCSDETLDHLIDQLRTQSGVTGAKISGSGRGDCVIALGTSAARVNGYEHFAVDIDPQGVRFDC